MKKTDSLGFSPKHFKDVHGGVIDAHMADAFMTVKVGNYHPGGITSGSGVALAANRLYATPFFVARKMTFDRIAVNVTTGAAGAMRLGVYNDSAGAPGSLKSDCGTVDTTNVAVVAVTISLQLTKGWYWLAGVCDATPSISKSAGSILKVPLGYNATNAISEIVGGYKAHTYGALPDPHGGITAWYGVNPAAPYITMRVASLD